MSKDLFRLSNPFRLSSETIFLSLRILKLRSVIVMVSSIKMPKSAALKIKPEQSRSRMRLPLYWRRTLISKFMMCKSTFQNSLRRRLHRFSPYWQALVISLSMVSAWRMSGDGCWSKCANLRKTLLCVKWLWTAVIYVETAFLSLLLIFRIWKFCSLEVSVPNRSLVEKSM